MERVLPPHRCLELKEAGYPQEGSRFVWVKVHGDWDLVERHEAPSADNRISAMTKDEAEKWTFEDQYLSPDECIKMHGRGYPQGKSEYLWHKDKHQHDKWVLYKRNRHNMSATADKDGFNRWVTAITHEEAECWKHRYRQDDKLMTKKHVDSLTFREPMTSEPRKSAVIFATTCRDRLINITEILKEGGPLSREHLHVTVYFWKEE